MNLNDAADGIVAVINAIDSDIRFYSEANELHSDVTRMTGEVSFRAPKIVGPVRNSPWEYEAVLTLATGTNKKDWPDAIRRLREYGSPFGTKSIYQALIADQTLAGKVKSCLPKQGGLLEERLVVFTDGERWTQQLIFAVRIGAEEAA